ncbi:MAG: hypothetical protein MH252_08295 [Thermosynechococcaceae cyanobacterium MS004]|nr:hypothetical protein [Thermosynechococcaceae cyanobacterium MS004]
MKTFCWGDRLIPYPVTDCTDTHALVLVDDQPRHIPLEKVKGWARAGDRVRVLMGYNWRSATVLETEKLTVQLDGGGVVPVWRAEVIHPLYVPEPVPMPSLEDYEEDEMSMAIQYGLLDELKIGDRVRIVLAGPPLEHLTGMLATVQGAETFGLVLVDVDGIGEKLFMRQQLDFVTQSAPNGTASAPSGTASAPNDTAFSPGQKVTHRWLWLGKSASSRVLVPI